MRFDQGAPGSEDNPGSGHRWLYMRTYHDGFHPFPKHMLYDLAADPLESHNLAEERPDDGERGECPAARLARRPDGEDDGATPATRWTRCGR